MGNAPSSTQKSSRRSRSMSPFRRSRRNLTSSSVSDLVGTSFDHEHASPAQKDKTFLDVKGGKSLYAQSSIDAPPPYTPKSGDFGFTLDNVRPRPSDLGKTVFSGGQAGPSITVTTSYGGKEDILKTLEAYNVVFIVDDSLSMYEDFRWQEACKALKQLTAAASTYDTDGIDICFLNARYPSDDDDDRRGERIEAKNVKSPDIVEKLFAEVQLHGATPTGERLWSLAKEHIKQLKAEESGPPGVKPIKPVNYIIITDGNASDDIDEVIKKLAERLDALGAPLSQMGIQFVQIGNDPGATAMLNKLDNDLGIKRDMVDTFPYDGGKLTADKFIEILLGGINRRVDRRQNI